MKWFRMAVLAIGILLSFSATTVLAEEAPTPSIWDSCKGQTSNAAICGDENKTEATGIVKNLINLLLYVIGILSVIMIIHSGLKYVNSRGDAEGVKSAKNTLLYSVTGLVIAMLAFTIVNFVVTSINSATNPKKPTGTTTNTPTP